MLALEGQIASRRSASWSRHGFNLVCRRPPAVPCAPLHASVRPPSTLGLSSPPGAVAGLLKKLNFARPAVHPASRSTARPAAAAAAGGSAAGHSSCSQSAIGRLLVEYKAGRQLLPDGRIREADVPRELGCGHSGTPAGQGSGAAGRVQLCKLQAAAGAPACGGCSRREACAHRRGLGKRVVSQVWIVADANWHQYQPKSAPGSASTERGASCASAIAPQRA